MKTMDGLVFNQAEFIALMGAVNASELLGIDNDAIVPTDKEALAKMALAGLEQLKAHGIVEEKDGAMLFPSELIGMATAVSNPQLVIQIMRDEPEGGQRQIMMYQAFQFIVEFTIPEEGQFRLARLPSTPAMLQRMCFLLSIENSETRLLSFAVNQDDFFQSKTMVDMGQDDAALDALQNGGASQDEASSLLIAMKNTQVSGMVAWLRVENGRVLDGRNLLSLKTPNSSWVLHQKVAGLPQLIVTTVDQESFLTIAYQLQMELIEANQK